MTSSWASPILAWIVAAVAVVLVAVLAPRPEQIGWMPVVFAVGLLAAFALQLRGPAMQGLLVRLATTVAGLVVVCGIGTVVLLLL